MQRDPLTVVYIASAGHSGSTLLDMLIAAHSRATTVGEAKNLRPRRVVEASCSCAARQVVSCPFWQGVGAELESVHGLRLEELDLMSEEDDTFRRDNLAFLDAVASVTGKTVIVDSSKNAARALRLARIEELRLRAVHLTRLPHGVVYSNVRKGRSWVGASRAWVRNVRRTRAALAQLDHARVRYEELAADPGATLAALMPRFGLELEPRQLVEWASGERHDCGGNRMRRKDSAAIRIDRAWERELAGWQKLAISALTLRARR